ncbi:MAG: undecaprenyl-diphosphate phosphatase [Clostridiales bacterium]|nr:undecaprenyl-diphosphate phosphatase [Clostridiales bacterium]
MEILNAILQGLIQGFTEFLPISSSGHLAVYQHFAGVDGEDATLFTVLLHLGTLLAVFIVYWKLIWELVKEFFSMLGDIVHRKFSLKTLNDNRRMLLMLIVSCVPLLFLLIPVGGGRRLMDVFSGLSTGGSILPGGLAFLFTAFLLLFGTWMAAHRKEWHKINTTDAVAVGFAQFLAAGFAGISRRGSTISTGMICGVPKNYMVRYSFILGIPAILAANVVELRDALEYGSSLDIPATVVGVVVAAATGVFAIKLLQWIMKKDLFKYFGYYCLALGIGVCGVGVVELFQ